MRGDGDRRDHRQQGRDIGMAAEQDDGEAGEQHVLARHVGQARQDQLERGEHQPVFQRDRRQSEVPQQRRQCAVGQRAAEMQSERPAQQYRRQGEQLAREDDGDERRSDDQRDRGGGGPWRHVQREQPEIRQGERSGGHRRDVARHRRHDRDVLDRAQPVLAGETMLVCPGVEIGVAEITHHQFVADLLARQRHQPGERQAPDAAIDQVIGGDRHGIDGEEDQPEERAARHHGEHGVEIEHAQREDRGAQHDQRDRRCRVSHEFVGRGQVELAARARCAGNIIPRRRHAVPPIPRLRDVARRVNPHTIRDACRRLATRRAGSGAKVTGLCAFEKLFQNRDPFPAAVSSLACP